MNKYFLTYKKDGYTYFKPFKNKGEIKQFISDDLILLDIKKIKFINIVKYFVYMTIMKIFEKYKKIDFCNYVVYNDKKHNAYEMTDIYSLYKLLHRFIKDTQRNIIDVGCGKGLSFLVFNSFFKEKSGIDFNKELCNTAKRNMRALNIDAHIMNRDADKYNCLADYDFIFIFNPFYGESMENLVLKIKGHDACIIYHNPVCKDILTENGFIELKSVRDVLGFEISIFKEARI